MQRADAASTVHSQAATAQGFTTQLVPWRAGSQRPSSLPETSVLVTGGACSRHPTLQTCCICVERHFNFWCAATWHLDKLVFNTDLQLSYLSYRYATLVILVRLVIACCSWYGTKLLVTSAMFACTITSCRRRLLPTTLQAAECGGLHGRGRTGSAAEEQCEDQGGL